MTEEKTEESWSKTTIGEIGEEIIKNEIRDVICSICEEPATKETIKGYTYCTICPEDTDERIYYCGECLFMCNKKHKRRGHKPQLQHLSITNVPDMQNHSSKLLTKYNTYSAQRRVDLLTDTTTILCRTHAALQSITKLGFEGFIQYQAVFVAAGSKTAIKVTSKIGQDMAKKILRETMHGAAGFQILSCAMEIGTICAMWYRGFIDGKELIRRCGKSIAGNTAAFAGGYLGFKVGAAIGTWIGPGLGTIIGGIIGSVVGSLSGQFMADEVFEKYFPQIKKLDPKKELKEALKWFHIKEEEMKDKNIWNEKYITKIYRQYAKMHHPDRNQGDSHKFIATTKHFGILIAELDVKRKSDKNKRQQRLKELIL